MAYDGIQYSSRVDNTTQRYLYSKVVDNVLNAPAYASRLIGSGKPFEGKTMDFALDVTRDTQGQWFTGLETLNSAAVSTTVVESFAQTAFTFPIVSIMLESFANVGSLGVIPIDEFKLKKGAAEAVQAIGVAAYGQGNSNQMHGLESIVDDGTNVGTIGGLSRSTYTTLKSTVTAAASSKLTLAQMDTLHDSISAAGLVQESPNVGVTTKTVWSLYSQLLAPNVRASYDEVGYDRVLMRAKYGVRNSADLRNSGGFTAISYRDMHIMKDDLATSGNLYFLNEDYMNWYGRNEVPEDYKDMVEHVDFGGGDSVYEGTGASSLDMPSRYHGFYFQKQMTIPEQAGRISRIFVIGNTIATAYRRQGKLTGVTGI